MRKQLFIRLGLQPEMVEWLAMSEMPDETPVVQIGSLSEAATQALGCRVVVLVPSSDVVLTHATVPTRNRQRILSAVPYQLEEQFAADVESIHFALGQRTDDGRVMVAAVAQPVIESWLSQLAAADIEPDIVTPDIFALPFEPEGWTALLDGPRSVIRTGRQAGAGLDESNTQPLLNILLKESGEIQPSEIRIIHCGGNALPEYDVPVALKMETCQAALLVLAEHFDEKNAINLLQGSYSRREQLTKLWRPWRAATAMLAALLLLHVGSTLIEYNRLSKQDAQLRQQIADVFKTTFPSITRIVDPKVQMQRALDDLRKGSNTSGNFLVVLSEIAQHFGETAGLEITRLSYKDGKVDITLAIADLQRLDQLKQRLTDRAKVVVEIQSATARDNKVEARLQIKERDA